MVSRLPILQKGFKNKLTNLANSLHHITKTQVVKNNLFFKKNDALKPYLMADNERFLRQLPYLQDAGFTVVPVPGTDSVDVIVAVKDVFSSGRRHWLTRIKAKPGAGTRRQLCRIR